MSHANELEAFLYALNDRVVAQSRGQRATDGSRRPLLDLLAALWRAPLPVALSDLATQASLRPLEARHGVGELFEAGFVEFDPDDNTAQLSARGREICHGVHTLPPFRQSLAPEAPYRERYGEIWSAPLH